MAVKTEDRTIGEHTYRVTQLTALKSRALFARLVRFVGPAAAAALGGGRRLSQLNVGELVSDIAGRVSDEELGYFCDVLGSCTEIVGSNGALVRLDRNVIDFHFAGHLLDMFTWMAFALEVNYSDFLSAWKRTPGAASMAPVSGPSPSPTASTGTFGVS